MMKSKYIAGLFYTLFSPIESPCVVYCYNNPDADDQLGFGFNIADGGGFLPVSDLTNEVTVTMDIGQALHAAKKGYRIARKGWNGTGMFAYYVPAGSYPSRMEAIDGYFENNLVPYREYLALKTAQNDVATWAPSTSDNLAVDWYVVD